MDQHIITLLQCFQSFIHRMIAFFSSGHNSAQLGKTQDRQDFLSHIGFFSGTGHKHQLIRAALFKGFQCVRNQRPAI